MDQNIEMPHSDSPKKSLRVVLVWMIIIAASVTTVIMWKSHSDEKRALVRNSTIVSKGAILGKPFPEDFEQVVDMDLLEKDVQSGNASSQAALDLYRMRKMANETLSLGVLMPEKFPKELDLELLQADADSGSELAATQLRLHEQRKLILENSKLGEEFPKEQMSKLDMELLKEDLDAGNSKIKSAILLFENRAKAKSLCVLGKPFSLDFYDHVNRELLQKDGEAGYSSSKEILKLADNRIMAMKLKIDNFPFPKDFFEKVDKDLLIADADAGNPDMQYAWARMQRDLFLPEDYNLVKKYLTMAAMQDHTYAQSALGSFYCTDEAGQQDYYKSVKYLTLAAEKGFCYAEYNLSIHYRYGRGGLKRDIKKANELLERAANGGECYAQFEFGKALGHGRDGYKIDYPKCVEWLKKSVDKGHIPAIREYAYFLQKVYRGEEAEKRKTEAFRTGAEAGDPYCMAWYGRALCQATGVERDQPAGIKWIQKSMDAGEKVGEIAGMALMADMLRNGGGGLTKDVAAAVKLHKILAKKDHLLSMNNLGSIYMHGQGNVKQDLPTAVKYLKMHTEYVEQNRSWLLSELTIGYVENLNTLGEIYRNGNGVDKDIDKAVFYFEKALQANFKRANLFLGDTFNYADHGVQDGEKMLRYYTAGAEAGDLDCQNKLGLAYESGELIAQDNAKALHYYKIAADKKHRYALWNLAKVYEEGKLGQKKDINEAIRLYKIGAEAKYTNFHIHLGAIYLEGELVPRDVDLVIKYYQQGANLNDRICMYNLGCIYGSDDYRDFGVKKDVKLAREYYEKSLKAGYEKAKKAIEELKEE